MATTAFHLCPACGQWRSIAVLGSKKYPDYSMVCMCSWCAHLAFEDVTGVAVSLSDAHVAAIVKSPAWPQLATLQRTIRLGTPRELAVADLSAERTEAARKPSAEFSDETPTWKLYLRGVFWMGLVAAPWVTLILVGRWAYERFVVNG